MRNLILFLLCCMYMEGYAQPSGFQFRSYSDKISFIASLDQYLHSTQKKQAIDTLNVLEAKAMKSGDKELAGELKLRGYAVAFSNIKEHNNDAIENKIKDIAANAADDNLLYLQADALQTLGNYYSENKQQQSASIESYIEAYDVYKNFTRNEFPVKQSYLYTLGGTCYRLEDYDNAIKYLNEARQTKSWNDEAMNCTIYNTLGLCYRNLKKYDSAIFYFKETYKYAAKIGNKAYEGIAEGNIGISYFHQGKYDEAIPLLKKDIESSIETNQLRNAANSMITLAAIYNSKNDLKNAEQLLEHAVSLSRSRDFLQDPAFAEQIYKQLYKVYAAKNDFRLAYLYADSASKANENLAQQNKTLALAKAHDKIEFTQHKLAAEKLQNRVKTAEFEIRKNRIISLTLGLSTIIFLVLGIMVLKKNKQIAAEKENSDKQRLRAENSEKFKQQFLANMSHEIRTPMNAVMGMTDLILEKEPRPDQLGFLKAISKSSDILLHIINDILDLSKIEAGKMELEAIDFSLAETIKQVTNTLTYRAEEKGLQIVTWIHDDVPDIVVGDPYRLNQILVNLGGNAIKFTERGGVEISIKKIKEEEGKVTVQCSVADTGVGIPADKLGTLFSNFTQVNSSDTRKFGGTGLGLSISKQLVEMQGGNITVESKPAAGTVFSFTITYAVGSQEKLQERVARETKSDGSVLNGLRILVADDNEYNRMVVRETLHLKADVHTDIVVNGEEAVKMVQQNDYDVVLMDVQMPIVNGMEATRYIRTQMPAPKNQVPIIAFTASILRSDIEMFMECGMNSYMPKPFKAWQLIHTLADVTGRKHVPATQVTAHRTNDEPIAPAFNPARTVTDLTYLTKFCEGNQQRMKKYVNMYLKTVPVFKETLIEAVAAKDLVTIKLRVHGFKPSWMLMGMNAASDLGNKIENQCENQNDGVYANVQLLLEQTDKSVIELSV